MNTDFTEYDPITGLIIACGSVCEDTLEHHVNAGTVMLLNVSAHPDTHYLDPATLAVLEYSAEEKVAKLRANQPGYAWQMPERVLIDQRPLAGLVAAAVAQTYADVDSIYDAAVGRRVTEYSRAEDAARAFKAAGFTGVVSDYISGHAQSNPTGVVQTPEWAAQQIIERADAFRWAELQMRNVRFARQADMRAATSWEALATAVASWEDFTVWLRNMLGV